MPCLAALQRAAPAAPAFARPRASCRRSSRSRAAAARAAVPPAPPPQQANRLATAAAAAALALLAAAPADARTVAIAISNLSLAPCANPVAAGTPGTSTFKAKCFEISGTATNPGKEELRNADVYGIVMDAENDPVLRSGRIGAIQSVPPGDSTFKLQITAAASQPLPFKLKNFRGSGTTGVVNVSGNPSEVDYDAGSFADGGRDNI